MASQRAGRLLDSFLLLAAGGIATIFALLVASQRLDFVDEQLAAWVLLFVPWQVLGLSIAKFGIDQVSFARVTADNAVRLELVPIVWRRVVPVAAVFALLTAYLYGSLAIGAVTGMSVAVDAAAIAMAADLNARRKYRYVAAAGLVNHPFFFAVFAGLSWLDLASPPVVALAFLGTSLLRLLILWPLYVRETPTRSVVLQDQRTLAVQQVLNYSMFRGDQIVVNMLALKMGIIAIAVSDIEQFVYLVRLPEIFIGISGALTPLYLPWVHDVLAGTESRTGRATAVRTVVVLFAIVILAAMLVVLAWHGREEISLARVLPFMVFAVLVFPANYLTYRAMRQHALGLLIRLLGFAVAGGLLVFLFAWSVDSFSLLLWIVPVQLMTFIILAARTPVPQLAR